MIIPQAVYRQIWHGSRNPDTPTDHDAVLSVATKAGPSGVQTVTVSKDGGSSEDITGQDTYTITENGRYKFTLTNGAGATASERVNVTMINKTVPSNAAIR